MKKSTGISTLHKTGDVERCWVLIGAPDGPTAWRFRRRSRSSGEAASVEAAWEWALAREERCGDVVGFFHTHPPGAGAQPSSRDIRTMRAWRRALGKPLLCVIAAGKELNGYVFTQADGEPQPVDSVLKGQDGWYTVKA